MTTYNYSVMYKGGAGVCGSSQSLRDVFNRLDNIVNLADTGSVIISRINITTEHWVGPRIEDEPSIEEERENANQRIIEAHRPDYRRHMD